MDALLNMDAVNLKVFGQLPRIIPLLVICSYLSSADTNSINRRAV